MNFTEEYNTTEIALEAIDSNMTGYLRQVMKVQVTEILMQDIKANEIFQNCTFNSNSETCVFVQFRATGRMEKRKELPFLARVLYLKIQEYISEFNENYFLPTKFKLAFRYPYQVMTSMRLFLSGVGGAMTMNERDVIENSIMQVIQPLFNDSIYEVSSVESQFQKLENIESDSSSSSSGSEPKDRRLEEPRWKNNQVLEIDFFIRGECTGETPDSCKSEEFGPLIENTIIANKADVHTTIQANSLDLGSKYFENTNFQVLFTSPNRPTAVREDRDILVYHSMVPPQKNHSLLWIAVFVAFCFLVVGTFVVLAAARLQAQKRLVEARPARGLKPPLRHQEEFYDDEHSERSVEPPYESEHSERDDYERSERNNGLHDDERSERSNRLYDDERSERSNGLYDDERSERSNGLYGDERSERSNGLSDERSFY